MAEYEHKSGQQVNVNFGETFNLTKKSPAIAKRIFKTYANAKSYVDNPHDTAIAGLILSVIQDTVENNGIYQINSAEQTDETPNSLKLIKIGVTKMPYEIGDGLVVEKDPSGLKKDLLTVKFDEAPLEGVGKTTDYVTKSQDGLKLNVQKIENVNSDTSKTFLLDAKNTKAYIDNMDAGTYNLKQ